MAKIGYINEKENNAVAVGVTVFLHAALLLLCWMWMAWMKPIPPIVLEPAGVMVGFGGSPEGGGTGDLTSSTAPNAENPSENATTEQAVETPQQPQPQSTTTPTVTTPVVTGGDAGPSTAPVTPTPPTPRDQMRPRNNSQAGNGMAGSSNSGGGPGSGGGYGPGNGPGTGNGGNGTGGVGYSISGWAWKQKPNPQPCANQYTGSIVYKVDLDGISGKVETVRLVKSSGIPQSIIDCIAEVIRKEAMFEEIGENNVNSSGTITINLSYGQ